MERSPLTHWLGTWNCVLQLTEPDNLPPAPGLSSNTLRQVVLTSVCGSTLRLRCSNAYGNGPLTLRSVQVAISEGEDRVLASSARTVTFDGHPSTTLEPGESRGTDPLDFEFAPMTRLAVTIHFGDVPSNVTGHPGSRTTSYLAPGNQLGQPTLTGAVKTEHWYVLWGIDVARERPGQALVVLGDSITDGRGSTTDAQDRWPDRLSRRLRADPHTLELSVLNAGLGGNAVLEGGLGPSAMERFARDVLSPAGARYAIVLEGVNDIGAGTDVTTVAHRLIAAYEQFIAAAHDRGIRIFGVPILPFEGSQYSGEAQQQARRTVNHWIRTSGKFDAVLDLDAAVRDPNNPERLLVAYDTGDHLHLSPEGYQCLADAVDLTLFYQR